MTTSTIITWRRRVLWLIGGGLAVWYTLRPFLPHALEPGAMGPDCAARYRVGRFDVALCAHVETPGDSGPVTITVTVDTLPSGTIASHYSDDTLMALPAGYTYYRWIDADWHLDLVIDPHTARTGRSRYYIGSHHGRLAAVKTAEFRWVPW